jgi:hypothetical protein
LMEVVFDDWKILGFFFCYKIKFLTLMHI